MYLKNRDIVELFRFRKMGSNTNLMSTGDKLYSYNTCIAQWGDEGIIGNSTKYSVTSSCHLSPLKPYVYRWTNPHANIPLRVDNLEPYL